MRIYLIILPILLLWPASSRADLKQVIAEYRTEIEAREAAHDKWLDLPAAEATMTAALSSHGIGFSMRYAVDWGGWLYVDWDSTSGFYANARNGLTKWSREIGSGRFDEEAVAAMLARGMEVLRHIDASVDPWFRDDLKNWVERAQWLDRAHDVGSGTPLYYHYSEMADRAFADSISPRYLTIGSINVFAPVPETASELGDAGAQALATLASAAEAAVASGDAEAVRKIIQDGAWALSYLADGGPAGLPAMLMLLQERMRYAQFPVTDLLARIAETDPGPVRDAMLVAAEDRLHDRMGHLLPLLASGAASDNEADRTSATSRALDYMKRLVMGVEDIKNPASVPSGRLRALSAAAAASTMLDIRRNGDANASELISVVNNLAGTFKLRVSPTAPFSVPAGVSVGLIEQTVEATDYFAQAMNGVADAIGGDPTGIDRAIRFGKAGEAALQPRAFVKEAMGGMIESVGGSTPYLRSIIGWFSG